MTENSPDCCESVFSQLLRMEFENRVFVNVVKGKRDNALLKLHTAELALERKDCTAAYTFLFEIYKTIEEDEYHDEYQCEAGDFNILLFSACVTSALAKYYIKAEELLLNLLTQTPNPIIYYTLATVYFYQLKFTEAQACLEKILNSLNSFSKSDLLWPWTDVRITNLSADEFKTRVLLLLYLIDAIKDLKCDSKAIALDEKKFLDKSNWIANRYKEVKLCGKRTHVGTFLRQDVYNLIRNSLDNLISIRLGNLPNEYKNVMMAIHTKVGECFGLRASEEAEVKKMKHKLIQTNVKVQNAQTQSHNFKQVHRSAQTEPLCMKNQASEDLELSLKQTAAKLKSAESSIANLKVKKLELEQQLGKEEDYYKQQYDKWLIKDQQNEFNLTKLQTLIEVLEEKGAKKDFMLMQNNQQLSDCIDLLTKTYQSIFKMQKKYYDHFITKCHNTVEMLARLGQNMTQNRLITQEEIFSSMSEWEAALQQCIKVQETFNVFIKDVKAAIVENRFSDILELNGAHVLPQEPPCLANQYFPSLVVSLGEYHNNKQNSEAVATCNRITEEKYTQTLHSFVTTPEVTSANSIQPTLSQLNQMQTTSEKTSHSTKSTYSETGQSDKNTLSNSSFNSSSSASLRSNIRKFLQTSSLNERGSEPGGGKVVESESACSSSRKLFTYIKNKLPSHDEPEIMRALNKFREQNNGKLTGLTLHFILFNVRKILGLSQPAWDEIKPQCNWQGNNGETSCSICFSLFEELPVTILKCKHKFHIECIRKWLAENSVCAICRIHVTMDEDFPPLKH